ncbi:unnamed protein product [Microthlaspi erraticum]|uniref:non-specific serine/threonine protein kinase n=1 Tax=Microthlaspi erraticum TaxID=1685480 RepID=A0A6D2HZ71_9BRAS|nr:unnamed protein product [Microthlaspi erraticum]
MDKVQQQADLIEKKISPFAENVGGLTDQKITGGSQTTQPPATSPPSPPSPDSASSGGGSQSPPPPVVVSPPPANQPPPDTTPPPTPPSSPPPSATPPPSPPQPQPPPPSIPTGDSPVVIPSPLPQLPLPALPPPTLVTQQPETKPVENGQQQPNNPISPPSPPFTPFSPPPPENSGSQGSPPSSFPSLPVIPLSPNLERNPSQSQPLDSPPAGGSNRVPSSSSSPPSISGSDNNSGGSNRHNANNNGNGGNAPHNNASGYTEKTMIGIGIAGVLIIIFVAAAFFVRRKPKKYDSPRSNQPYLPPDTVSVNTEGFIHYRQKLGNSRSSAQNSSPDTNNSLGNPRHGRATPDQAVIGTAKTLFTYEVLSQITEGFSKRFIIGEGGFGCVYKGVLSEGKPIAIKQLKSISAEGYREFKAEVEIISRVHHRHLVSLVGYCISEQHRFLIYEFVPNNTLDYHLHGKDLPVLEWTRRVKIAIGAAKGLAYLHEDCHPKIIHRDIKSSNILLDDEFEAQAKYLAPEYASSGKLTDRSDVFSFGVVLLELITGRKPVDTSQPLGEESLVEWARPRLIEAIEKGDISEVVDPRLEKRYVEGEVFRMIETAASCVRHSALKRPRMVQVVRALDTRDDMSDLTNGVKVGQSTVYNSGQYSNEIRIFRRASEDSSDFGTNNSYYPSQDYTSRESESRAFNNSTRRNQ